MFHNVLVPVDGTALAEHALPWAIAAARPSGVVHLVHVHEVVSPFEVEGMVMTGPPLDDDLRAGETADLAGLASRVRSAAPGQAVTTRLVEPEGPFVERLIGAVTAAAADLVVVATRGRGPFARFWLGSVTEDLIRPCPVPVLVVRPADPTTPADLSHPPRLRHLVVPLDGTALAEEIVEPAARLGSLFGADFTLLSVADAAADRDADAPLARTEGDPADLPAAADRTGAYLAGVARRFAGRGAVHYHVDWEGPVADRIVEQAQAHAESAVALATHARAGLSRLMAGSVADEVIRRATGPVLVLHPPARHNGG